MSACQRQLPTNFTLPAHSETYESFGEVTGGVHDLEPVLAAMRAERRAFVSPDDADSEMIVDVPVRPAVAWRYVVDPIERLRWACRQSGKDPDIEVSNARGRTGDGSTSHCGHAPLIGATREYADWRPFDYFTARISMSGMPLFGTARRVIETFEFTPLGDHGTRIAHRVRPVDRGRLELLSFRASHRFGTSFERRRGAALLSLVDEDTAALELDA